MSCVPGVYCLFVDCVWELVVCLSCVPGVCCLFVDCVWELVACLSCISGAVSQELVCLLFVSQELDDEAKRILEGLEQRKLEKGGKKAGIGKFAHASLDKNKKLGMFNTTENGG